MHYSGTEDFSDLRCAQTLIVSRKKSEIPSSCPPSSCLLANIHPEPSKSLLYWSDPVDLGSLAVRMNQVNSIGRKT